VESKLFGKFLKLAGAFLLIGGPIWVFAGRFAFWDEIGFLAAGVFLTLPWNNENGGSELRVHSVDDAQGGGAGRSLREGTALPE
jgi:hypothetical protein